MSRFVVVASASFMIYLLLLPLECLLCVVAGGFKMEGFYVRVSHEYP